MQLRALRQRVTETIEPLRREKVIGSSLEAEVSIPAAVPAADFQELFITSAVTQVPGDDVGVSKSAKHKCGRCWRHLPEVTDDGALCSRCDNVVGAMEMPA
jgi:isoleucyl-tRNA synthetase